MRRPFIYFTAPVMCALLAGCAHNAGKGYTIVLTDSVVISDKGKIGNSYGLFAENDSSLYLLNIPNEVFRLSLSSGTASPVFDSLDINIDSVIACTYQKKNAGKMIYSKHTGRELQNTDKSLFQVYSVSPSENGFFIPVSVTAEAGYTDPEFIKKQFAGATMNMDSIIAVYGSAGIKSIDFLFFLLETDRQFHIKRIEPLYGVPGTNNYSILPLKGCFARNGVLFIPNVNATVSGILFDSVSIENREPSFYFCSQSLEGAKSCKPIIPEQLIDGSKHSLLSHVTDAVSYSVYKGRVISSMGKELIDLDNDRPFEFQPSLDTYERIEAISVMQDILVLVVSNKTLIPFSQKEKRQFGTTMELNEKHIRMYDPSSGELLMDQRMDKDATIQAYGNTIFCMTGGASATPVLRRYKIIPVP
jgi:hypothetical protein